MTFDIVNILIDRGTKIKVFGGYVAAYTQDNEDNYALCNYAQYLGDGLFQMLYQNGKPHSGKFIPCGYLPTTDKNVDLLKFRISQNCRVEFRGGKMHVETVVTKSHRITNAVKYLHDGLWILESAMDVKTPLPKEIGVEA